MTTLPETPEIKTSRERARERGVDFDGAKHRADAVIDFIEARALDIEGHPKLEQWHKDAILEAFEIGPEAMFKEGVRVDHVVCWNRRRLEWRRNVENAPS